MAQCRPLCKYETAYKRIVELVPRVFPTGAGLRYMVLIGIWDDSPSNGGEYVALTCKEFTDTLEAYDAAEPSEE